MAPPGSWWWLFSFFIFSLGLVVLPISAEGPFPSANTIKRWVDKMQEDLVRLVRTASGVDELAKIYQEKRDLYTIEANNAQQLVESAARDIEKLLSNRSTALVRLAEAAERFQKEHQWQNEFATNDIVYYNAKDDLNEYGRNESEMGSQRIKPVFEDDPVFGRQTSYQHAAVHIPTDIYDGYFKKKSRLFGTRRNRSFAPHS